MSYTGDLTPTDSYDLLTSRDDAVLVDCRTRAEWAFVGVPAFERTRFVEWTTYPDGSKNENFVRDVAGGLAPDQPLVVICRSGARSAAGASALTEAGFTEVYNVLDGFEGDHDQNQHRSGGWRGAGLPWKHQ